MAIGTGAALLGSAVIGGAMQSRSAGRAASAQVDANENAMAFQRENGQLARDEINAGAANAVTTLQNGQRGQINVLNRGFQQQRDILSPDIRSGRRADKIRNYLNGMGDRPAGYDGMRETDAYRFRFNEGMNAIEGSAAAGGNLFSGATLKALQRRGMGLADQFENNYYNRIAQVADTGRSARNWLAGQAGQRGVNVANVLGNTAGAVANVRNNRGVAVGNAFTGQGNALSNAAIGIGNARSAGAIAQGNAWSDTIQNGLGGYMWANQAGLTGGGGGSKAFTKSAPWFS